MTLLQSNQVAQALKVDEKTVARWIETDKLPAANVDGELRIDPIDLLEWATERSIKVDLSLYDMQEAETHPLPSLSEALQVGGIFAGVEATDKADALRQVVARFDCVAAGDPELILLQLLAREAMGSTAVGRGIAIPHLRNPILVHSPCPMVSLTYLSQPVDFEAPDGKPVRILFTMLSGEIRAHLHLLSEIAFCVRDPRLRKLLEGECDPEAIMTAVWEIERELGGRKNRG